MQTYTKMFAITPNVIINLNFSAQTEIVPSCSVMSEKMYLLMHHKTPKLK